MKHATARFMTSMVQCMPLIVENPMQAHKTSNRFVTRQNAGMRMLELLIFCRVMNIFTEASHFVICKKLDILNTKGLQCYSIIDYVQDIAKHIAMHFASFCGSALFRVLPSCL